jgi:hypothetical protein
MSAHYLIRIVEEQGSVVAEMQDVAGLVDNVLIPHAERCQGIARHIDPYGRTSFNGMQCEALLAEFDAIQPGTLLDVQRSTLRKLVELAQRAITEVHLHLVFLGD